MCEACPAHTRSTPDRTRCELFEVYNFAKKYMLNMVKFDSTRNVSVNELKDTARSGSFFGPFYAAESHMYFFSLFRPMEYDVEKYEYEADDDDDNTVQEGHIFLLETLDKQATSVSDTRETLRRTHYRARRNLGSRLQGIDTSQLAAGEVTLRYVHGDPCGEGRHEARIRLICDRTVQSLSHVESLDGSRIAHCGFTPDVVCVHNFVWRTPYACSQCKMDETTKYYVSFGAKTGSRNARTGDAASISRAERSASFMSSGKRTRTFGRRRPMKTAPL